MLPRPVVALFLAAGSGRRYAQARAGENKLLATLPGHGDRVVDRSLAPITQHCDELVAVVGTMESALVPVLRAANARVIVATDAMHGMGHSLAAGAREALYRFPSLAGMMIALADMPWIAPDTIQRVATALRDGNASDGATAVRPRVDGRPAHPVGFFANHVSALTALHGDLGARTLLRSADARMRWIDVEDYGALADVDLPEDIGEDIGKTFDAS